MEPSPVRLLATELPLQPEYRPVWGELDSVLRSTVSAIQRGAANGLDRAKSQARGQLDYGIGEDLACAGELAPSCYVVNESIGVHQALQERESLLDARLEVRTRNELAIRDTH